MSKKSVRDELKSIVDKKKRNSKELLLRTLYFEGANSTLQLAKVLKTSVPTSAILINDLIIEKWIIERGEGESRSGRKPVTFQINENFKKILSVELNNLFTKLIIFDLNNAIIFDKKMDIGISTNDFVNLLSKEIKKINQEYTIWGVGISLTGLVNKRDKKSYTYPTLNIDNASLEAKLSILTQLPTFVIHNTTASVLGERYFGAAKAKPDVLLLHLDWGLSLGIISNCEIVKGTNGFGGEIGHIQIYPNGKLCRCGKIGCLETVASASALLNRLQEGIDNGEISILSKHKENLTIDHFFEAIEKGDNFAIESLYEVGNEIGRGISIAVHLLNPELIIIDGLLSRVGEYLITSIEQSLHKYCLSGFKENLEIKISPLGSKAKSLGVVSYVFEQMITKEFEETL